MKKLFFLPAMLFAMQATAQNDRLHDRNNISWVQFFVVKAITKKTDWLVEYQWRRTDGLKNWQQGLFRTAIQYKPNNSLSLAVGYAEAETFVYGDHPIASNGTFPEHRIFEQLILKQSFNKISFTSRFRIEQRWLGRIKPGTNREINEWVFLHRFRYQARFQIPLCTKKEQQLYIAVADEIFISAGKNVGVNIFDQNRLFVLAGCKINKVISLETGYINQTLQQGRRVNNRTIIQRNNGWILASYLNF